jgi:Glycolipid transfer protein (GLTP)
MQKGLNFRFQTPINQSINIRGLTFTCQALQNMQDDTSSELHVCFQRSYDAVLRHHHTFVIRSVVSVRQLDCFFSVFGYGAS